MRHAADLKGFFVQKPQFLSSIHTLEYDIQKKSRKILAHGCWGHGTIRLWKWQIEQNANE